MPHNEQHECDLFLMSSHTSYHANKALKSFAKLGCRNIHGWGIGSYISDKANIIRIETPAIENGNVTESFKIAIDAVASPVIVGHLRLASRGSVMRENNHPFKLSFLGYDWLMAHNGTAHKNDLVPHNEQLLINSTNDSARVFEYLRREIINYFAADPKRSLIEACRSAYSKLLQQDPFGSYNIILTNGYINFVFIHWRPFYMLRREKDGGDATLVSTYKLSSDEEWIPFNVMPEKKAKMLVFCGPTLIMNGDIPR